MNQDFDFFKTSMPSSRQADYYLGCLDGSVFIDFNRTKDDDIKLVRISFDGYGCCDLDEQAKSLNLEDSKKFIEEVEKEELNQETLEELVKKVIEINKDLIWSDAIEEYGLVKKE